MKRVLAFLLFVWWSGASVGLEITPDAEILPKVRATLKDRNDYAQRSIRKKGNKTIELEAFISQEGNIKLAPQILGNFSDYARWALRGINERPGGGSYYLKIQALGFEAPDILKADCMFTLPVFKKEFTRQFRMGKQQQGEVLTLTGETLPNETSPVESAAGYLKVFPAEGSHGRRVWIYVKGEAVLRPWLLYEALPERLMTGEAGERIQIVLDNYLAEEDRLLLKQQTARKSAH